MQKTGETKNIDIIRAETISELTKKTGALRWSGKAWLRDKEGYL